VNLHVRLVALTIGLTTMSSTLAGCGAAMGIAHLASPTRENVTEDQMVLPKRPSNFIDDTIAVGEALDYRLSGTNRSDNSVRFGVNGSMLKGVFLGVTKNISLTVTLQGDGRTVKFQYVAVGNWSTAKQETVDKELAEFKAAMTDKFN